MRERVWSEWEGFESMAMSLPSDLSFLKKITGWYLLKKIIVTPHERKKLRGGKNKVYKFSVRNLWLIKAENDEFSWLNDSFSPDNYRIGGNLGKSYLSKKLEVES